MSTTKELNKKVVLTAAQFESRRSAGTLQEGVEYEISDALDAVESVTINGTSIVDATTHVANIPIASSSGLGLVKANISYGIEINEHGIPAILKATDGDLTSKSSNHRPVVPSNLNKAVMEGLGNNSLTWSDTYKAAARNTIGCVAMAEYDPEAASYAENTLYYVVED